MRIGIKAPRRVSNADPLQQRNGLSFGRLARCAAVQSQRLGHLVPNAVHRVQRRHRFLKNHADAVAAQLPQGGVTLPHQLLLVKADAA